MIITGIAHPPEWLNERSSIPSAELVFLAKKALKAYKATHLVTSLEPGWEMALAKAALELGIAFTVALPYPERHAAWNTPVSQFYDDLLHNAVDIYQISDAVSESALMDCHFWKVDHAEAVLALWDYEFVGKTYKTMLYGLEHEKVVINLWQDWQALYRMRRSPVKVVSEKKRGAQMFDRGSHAPA